MTDKAYLQKINGNPGFVDGATIPPFASKEALDASGSGWEIGTIANAAGVNYSWRGAGVGWVIVGGVIGRLLPYLGQTGYKQISGNYNANAAGGSISLGHGKTSCIVFCARAAFDYYDILIPPIYTASDPVGTEYTITVRSRAIGQLSDIYNNVAMWADDVVVKNLGGAQFNFILGLAPTKIRCPAKSIPRTDGGSNPMIQILVNINANTPHSFIPYAGGRFLPYESRPNGDVIFARETDSIQYDGSFAKTAPLTDTALTCCGAHFKYSEGRVLNVARFGDSILCGSGGAYSQDGMVGPYAEIMREQGVIVESMNFASEGATAYFYDALARYISDGVDIPDILVSEIWTPNTFADGDEDEWMYAILKQYRDKAFAAINKARIPTYWQSFGPVDPVVHDYGANDSLRRKINSDNSDLISIDFSALVSGTTDSDGQVLPKPGSLADGIHPVQWVYDAMAKQLASRTAP